MGNCLKTQLKEVVNNSNLNKIGGAKYRILDSAYAAANPSRIEAWAGTSRDGEFNSDHTAYIIRNKYILTSTVCQFDANKAELNLDDLQYSALTELIVMNQKIKGSLKSLPSTIQTLACGTLTANVTDIGHMTSVTDVQIQPSVGFTLIGNIEDFVSMQIQAGRTSCNNLVFGNRNFDYGINAGLKFNGAELTTSKAKIVSWNWDGTSANITVTDL